MTAPDQTGLDKHLLIALRETVATMQDQLAQLATRLDQLLSPTTAPNGAERLAASTDGAEGTGPAVLPVALSADTIWTADRLPALIAGSAAASDEPETANGVDFHSGTYLLKLQPAAARNMAQARPDSQELRQLHNAKRHSAESFLGTVSGIDEDDLTQSRWAVVVNATEPTSLLKALTPLIEHRARQQGITLTAQQLEFRADETCGQWYGRLVTNEQDHKERWLELPPVLIYRVGEDGPERASRWLARHGVAMAPVDPRRGVPFYLMLAGRPGPLHAKDTAYMPFEFQYELDQFWGVGRICFTSDDGQHALDDYTTYAERVVAFESRDDAASQLRKEIVYFGTQHHGDQATTETARHLIAPLTADWHDDTLTGAWRFGFTQRLFLGDGAEMPYLDGRQLKPHGAATRSSLTRLLEGDGDGRPPAILFLASHGAGLKQGTVAEYVNRQGALLTQGWGGEGDNNPEHWFSGADLERSTKVEGMVAFLFACFGGGSPEEDQFVFDEGQPRPRIAPFPFVARLPQRLLLHGSLGVLGHVDRAWTYAFRGTEQLPRQSQQFEQMLSLIAAGKRLGFATDDFNLMQSVRAAALADLLEDMRFGKQVLPTEVMRLWKARNDARNYTLIGDPAVRLPFKA